MVRDEAQTVAKHLKDCGIIGIAQSRRGLDQRIEYFLQVERRPADESPRLGATVGARAVATQSNGRPESNLAFYCTRGLLSQ